MKPSITSVWVVARAGVRRRRGQTVMIGVIVTLCTATILVGLALLAAVSGPFDRTFAQLSGAHATMTFDGTKATEQQVAATAQAEGVTASAGPFPMTVVPLETSDGRAFGGAMRVVGRTDPDAATDKLSVQYGRWPTGPNEMVLSNFYRFGPDPASALGQTFTMPKIGTVTVVGVAYSVTRTADVWMLPDAVRQIGANSFEMLYRFNSDTVGTAEQMTSHTAAITASLPADAVTATSSYLTIRERAGKNARTISTFLTVFAALSLIVAILVISNVVSGAVIAGFRSIGVLKAVGFTPSQVTSVFLTMMIGPAVVGSVAGAVLGHLGAVWLLGQFNTTYVLGVDNAPTPWLHAVAVGVILILVALTALTPALRAGRQSATTALSARANQIGRGRNVQRRLSRSSLPRSVSLGLALPVVRPARSLLTLVAIVLGSVTVVFATGLLTSAQRWNDALTRLDHVQVAIFNPPPGGPSRFVGDDRRQAQGTIMTDPEVEAFLRGLPGTKYVTVVMRMEGSIAGTNENVELQAQRGDSSNLGFPILSGRWYSGAAEAVMGTDMLRLTGKSVGDTITLYADEKTITVKIVGEVFSDEQLVMIDQASLPADLVPRKTDMYQYFVGLQPGVTAQDYIDRVADGGNAGLIASRPDDDGIGMVELIIVVGTLTALLVLVSALGVAHTVVLNARERRRDLAITKAVGMTPGQAVIMAVTSMAALGLIGGALGLPGGIAAQQYIIRAIGDSEDTGLPRIIIDVYGGAQLSALFLCGVVIAVLGALLPARRAARVSTAEALHTE